MHAGFILGNYDRDQRYKSLLAVKKYFKQEGTPVKSLCLVAVIEGETLFMVLLARNLRIKMLEKQDRRKWNILLVKRVGILQIIPRSFPISEGWTFLWILLYLIDRIPGYSTLKRRKLSEMLCICSFLLLLQVCPGWKGHKDVTIVISMCLIYARSRSYTLQSHAAGDITSMQPCHRSKSWAVKVSRYYTI